jgi:hypothetical protein
MAGNNYNCGICVYYKSAEIMGSCRRYPRSITKHKNEWCGEFKEAEFVSVPVYDIMTDQVSVHTVTQKKRGRPRK